MVSKIESEIKEQEIKLDLVRSSCRSAIKIQRKIIEDAQERIKDQENIINIEFSKLNTLKEQLLKEKSKKDKINISNEWGIIDQLGWKENPDYKYIHERMKNFMTENQIKELESFCYDRRYEVDLAINDHVSESGEWIGDDGYNDLCWHIVGCGEEFYNSVMDDPNIAVDLIRNNEYVESFAYCF